MLFKPDSLLSSPRPLWPQHWSPWFMAAEAELVGGTVTLINVYGPSGHRKKEREELFATLRGLPRPAGRLLLGGDFNCTMDPELDRSHRAGADHGSAELQRLLEHWGLRDASQDDQDCVRSEVEKWDYQARHHTYKYRLRNGDLATSRLDRWYVSAAAAGDIRGLAVEPPVNKSDHDAVTLVLATAPDPPSRSRRRQQQRLRYPLPFGCHEPVRDLSKQSLEAFAATKTDGGAAATAHAYDECKTQLRSECLRLIRQRLKQQRRAFQQRRKRLGLALKAALRIATGRPPESPATLESITLQLEDLALDPQETVMSSRRSITRLHRARARRRRRARTVAYLAGTPEADRAFFRRFSTKSGHRHSTRLPAEEAGGRSPANRVAADWATVTQRGPTSAVTRDKFYALLPEPSHKVDLSQLDVDITVEEVRTALRACPRGKAAGPDGLPNDWYRDQEDHLPEVLAPLLNAWHKESVLPPSFRQATIACLPKTTKPRSGLDYRPIALLNTDYKIYARVLLNRLRPHLPELVAPTQSGFVPGRQVHDTLDVFHAIQALVRNGGAPPTALAVLLDFAKAYDSLDRPFLLQVLRRAGFPPRFIAAMNQMHLLTTAEYGMNGDVSETHAILNGIRQGCPLAPTLFVIAVNTLYEAIAADEQIAGITLLTGETVKVSGFADDTTAFVADEQALEPLKRLLDLFAEASGLAVNASKCVVVPPSAAAPAPSTAAAGFTVAGASSLTRLLGGQVASGNISAAVWELTAQQIRTRLHLGIEKTTNELQRVRLAKAVLLPKFLFVARHHWPSAAQVNKMQRLLEAFVWTCSFDTGRRRKRAWLSSAVARAPAAQGGLGIPHLTHELQALSVDTTQRWLSPSGGLRRSFGAVLMNATPANASARRLAPTKPILQRTLAATGLQLRHAMATIERDADERELLTQLLPAVGRGSSLDYQWDGHGTLRINYGRVAASTAELRRLQATKYGNLNVPALLQARIIGDGILVNQLGNPVTTRDFPTIVGPHDSLADVLSLAWHPTDDLLFQPKKLKWPLTPIAARGFRRLCDSLVLQYPGLLRPRGRPEDVVLRPASLDIWHLQAADTGHDLIWNPVADAHLLIARVWSTADATAAARQVLQDSTIAFESHDWLDYPFALWRGSAQPSTSSAKRFLAKAACNASRKEAAARAQRWHAEHGPLATALDTLTWTSITKTPGTTAAQRLLLHRLKGGRLTSWDTTHNRVGCPHCVHATAAGGKLSHVFWECPQAGLLWNNLLSAWSHLWAPKAKDAEPGDHLHEIFSLQLQAIPDLLWLHHEVARLGKPTADDTISVHLAVQAAWRQQVLHTVQTIWRWRHSGADGDGWTSEQATAFHNACLRSALQELRWTRQPHSGANRFTDGAVRAISTGVAVSACAPQLADGAQDQFVLFFDGGSRGNPGPGGAGSVVVKVPRNGAAATLVWTASMSYASATTTNNTAEYAGLLNGLTAAAANRWTPLEVVGDSQFILAQMRSYRAPANARLRTSYAAARRLADQLGVRRWVHHPRVYNCMADAAANIAMDTRTSIQLRQPTTNPAHARLADHLASDLAYWLDTRMHKAGPCPAVGFFDRNQ